MKKPKAVIVGAIIGAIGAIIAAIIIVRCSDQTNSNNGFNFLGWYPWGELQASVDKNTVTLNGKISSAGYVNEKLDMALNNKTIILEIKNINSSNFSEGRLFKITVNANDQLIRPIGITNLIQGEYIPIDYNKVEFVIPNNFDGKLGIVFYQADIKNLKITAYYK